MIESQKELVCIWAGEYFGTCVAYDDCERWAEGFLKTIENQERIKECLEGETEMREKDMPEIERLKMRIEELTKANEELEAKIISLEEEKEEKKEEEISSVQETKKPKGRPCVPVIAIPETGETIRFGSIKEAADELAIHPNTIQKCLKNGKASCGYCFDYAV